MINLGVHNDQTWPDQWTSVTEDGKRSAQFEHTMIVTDDGVEILTARTENSPPFKWDEFEDIWGGSGSGEGKNGDKTGEGDVVRLE